MDFSRRSYRQGMSPPGFVFYECKIKETDLHISVNEESYNPDLVLFTQERILFFRSQLEKYIQSEPLFQTTLEPYLITGEAPPIVWEMVRAANTAGIGPMSAVAGTIAELVGRDLLRHVKEVIVENGGDIFISTLSSSRVAVFAGTSPFSNNIALELPQRAGFYGVCTSSGTVGPSLSLGKADAAVIIAASTPLADAVATATANRVKTAEDLSNALDFARRIKGIEGVLLIKEKKMAVWGTVKLVPVTN